MTTTDDLDAAVGIANAVIRACLIEGIVLCIVILVLNWRLS